MKRLTKVLQKDGLIPEFGYFILTPKGGIAWSGSIGIKYSLKKIGERLGNLVRQHGSFAILDGLQFIRVISVLEKVSGASIDKNDSVLIIESNNGDTRIQLPIELNINEATPHLQIDWDAEGIQTPIRNLWVDAQDLLTNEGTPMWGDVIGIYETAQYRASFDYGILLYEEKTSESEHKDFTDTFYCPKSLLDLGLSDVSQAKFTDSGVFLIGEDVTYFTSQVQSTEILKQLLELRNKTTASKEYAVNLNFSSGLWKRAKVFNKLTLILEVANGIITLRGGNWMEHVGQTDAPDALFTTRISLLQRWGSGVLGHKIYVSDSAWYLYGRTRKGSEFFGNLTTVPKAIQETQEEIPELEELDDTACDFLG